MAPSQARLLLCLFCLFLLPFVTAYPGASQVCDCDRVDCSCLYAGSGTQRCRFRVTDMVVDVLPVDPTYASQVSRKFALLYAVFVEVFALSSS